MTGIMFYRRWCSFEGATPKFNGFWTPPRPGFSTSDWSRGLVASCIPPVSCGPRFTSPVPAGLQYRWLCNGRIVVDERDRTQMARTR